MPRTGMARPATRRLEAIELMPAYAVFIEVKPADWMAGDALTIAYTGPDMTARGGVTAVE